MNSGANVNAVRKRARTLFANGVAQSREVQTIGKISVPIRIVDPDGTLNSWFVAVQVRDKLAGYLQLSPDLVLMRYASFWRGEEGFKSCPDARSWLDPFYIRERAQTVARPAEHLGEPYLTYDKSPTRIAWGVKTTDEEGEESVILVAGESAFRRD